MENSINSALDMAGEAANAEETNYIYKADRPTDEVMSEQHLEEMLTHVTINDKVDGKQKLGCRTFMPFNQPSLEAFKALYGEAATIDALKYGLRIKAQNDMRKFLRNRDMESMSSFHEFWTPDYKANNANIDDDAVTAFLSGKTPEEQIAFLEKMGVTLSAQQKVQIQKNAGVA